MFGGVILKTKVKNSWHFYNQIESKVFDFSSGQFEKEIVYQNEQSSVEEALTDCTESQVAALMAKFKHFVNQ